MLSDAKRTLPASGARNLASDRLVDDQSILEETMAKVTAFEAKTRFGELLDRVAEGEEVVITRHDKPVARLVPEGAPALDEVRRAVAGLRELQQRIRRRSAARLSKREVRSAIEKGRR
jgi:prevent-host-death family protein